MKIDLCDGKYTVLLKSDGTMEALRHGEKWRDLTGDGLVLALAQRIEDLEGLKAIIQYGVALPYITDDLFETFNETDLIRWDKQTARPDWTQTAVDFACVLKVANPDG